MRVRNSGADPKILDEVNKAFGKFRETGGNKARFSTHLRSLVMSAVDRGHSVAASAKAAGISEQSVNNWLRTRPSRPQLAEELTLVPDNLAIPSLVSGMARVHIGARVLIEVPLSGLTPALVAVFASAGSVTV